MTIIDGADMAVSKNKGTPKWMAKIMENPMNKWMNWRVKTPIFGIFPTFLGIGFPFLVAVIGKKSGYLDGHL